MILRSMLAATLAFFAPPQAVDPLDGLTEESIDIEIKGAPIDDVLRLIGDITQVKIEVEPCVSGTVDLALDNVRVRMLLENLGAQLNLVYSRSEADALVVGCASAPSEEPKLTVQLSAVSAAEALRVIAPATSVVGCDDRLIDMDIRNATRRSIVSALVEQLDATVVDEGGARVVQCH